MLQLINLQRSLQPTIVANHFVKQFRAKYHLSLVHPSQHLPSSNSNRTFPNNQVHRRFDTQRTTDVQQPSATSLIRHFSSTSPGKMASTYKKAQPKIKVYWLNESRAQRLIWLLEELHLEYDLEIFHRDKDMLAPPELKEIHPLGKAPIVTIQPLTPEGSSTPPKPLVLAESGFIMQYISDHFGKDTTLVPQRYPAGQEGQLGAETESWMRYQYYLHYSEGSLQPTLLVSLVLGILKSNRIPFPIRPITAFVSNKFFTSFVIPHLNTDLAFLESQLESSPDGGEFLCGKYLTPADIILSFPLELAKTRIGNLDASIVKKYPKLWAYLDRIRSSEGYKRAEKRIEEVEAKGKK